MNFFFLKKEATNERVRQRKNKGSVEGPDFRHLLLVLPFKNLKVIIY